MKSSNNAINSDGGNGVFGKDNLENLRVSVEHPFNASHASGTKTGQLKAVQKYPSGTKTSKTGQARNSIDKYEQRGSAAN